MTALKEKLVALLEQLPGIEHKPWPDRSDGFSTLHAFGQEIGHFHHFGELDLRLGKRLIKAEQLEHPADSTVHPHRSPNSAYIELRFTTERDLPNIVRLVAQVAEGLSA